MMQSRTHTCGQLRLSDAGKQVKILRIEGAKVFVEELKKEVEV